MHQEPSMPTPFNYVAESFSRGMECVNLCPRLAYEDLHLRPSQPEVAWLPPSVPALAREPGPAPESDLRRHPAGANGVPIYNRNAPIGGAAGFQQARFFFQVRFKPMKSHHLDFVAGYQLYRQKTRAIAAVLWHVHGAASLDD